MARMRNLFYIVAMLAVMLLWFGNAAASQVTIIGQVNDNYQIVTDDKIYDIADDEKGNDLAENYIGAKVKVTGTVEQSDDTAVITVQSFQAVSE